MPKKRAFIPAPSPLPKMYRQLQSPLPHHGQAVQLLKMTSLASGPPSIGDSGIPASSRWYKCTFLTIAAPRRDAPPLETAPSQTDAKAVYTSYERNPCVLGRLSSPYQAAIKPMGLDLQYLLSPSALALTPSCNLTSTFIGASLDLSKCYPFVNPSWCQSRGQGPLDHTLILLN